MKKYVKAASSTKFYSETIWEAFRSSLGLDEDDDSRDAEIDGYTNNELFDMVCDYNGMMGYGDTIRDWVLDVYDVNLDDYS